MLPFACMVASGANQCNTWLRLSVGAAREQSRVLLAWLPKQLAQFAVAAGGSVMQVGLSASPPCFCCLPGTALLLSPPFLLPANTPNTATSEWLPLLQATLQLGSTEGLTGAFAINLGQQSLPEHVEAFATGRQGACTGLGYSADGSLLASAWSTGQVSCIATCRCWCPAAMHWAVACDRNRFALHCCRMQLRATMLTRGCPSFVQVEVWSTAAPRARVWQFQPFPQQAAGSLQWLSHGQTFVVGNLLNSSVRLCGATPGGLEPLQTLHLRSSNSGSVGSYKVGAAWLL